MKAGLLVFVGGGLGANLRYWLARWVGARFGDVFPWGTTIINITGSIVIGLFMAALMRMNWSPELRLFVAVGLLGGYTTFSSFSYEAIGLMEQGSYAYALGYILMNVVLSLTGCWLGIVLARTLMGAA